MQDKEGEMGLTRRIGKTGIHARLEELASDGWDSPVGLVWPADKHGMDASVIQSGSGDGAVARYFRDVRKFSLLTRKEEKNLWVEIESAFSLVHRALYFSPVAVPVLAAFFEKLKTGTVALDTIVHKEDSADLSNAISTFNEQVAAIAQIASEIQELPKCYTIAGLVGSNRRLVRIKQKDLLTRYSKEWTALHLRPSVHEAIRAALVIAVALWPADRAVQRAHLILVSAGNRLKRLKDHMLHSNLRLVIHIANRFRGLGVPFEDLLQEGNIGLMRALEKFEHQRGLKFVTYAHWWVRQAISRAVTEQHHTVRLPNHVVERLIKLQATYARLYTATGCSPSVEEISATTKLPVKDIEELLTLDKPTSPLDEPLIGWNSTFALEDVLADVDAPLPEEHLVERQMRCLVEDSLDSLLPREALILRMRFGLGGYDPHTLQEVADILGLSRERVRQLESGALEKLRQPRRSAVLAELYE